MTVQSKDYQLNEWDEEMLKGDTKQLREWVLCKATFNRMSTIDIKSVLLKNGFYPKYIKKVMGNFRTDLAVTSI